MKFADRRDSGKRLAERLSRKSFVNPLILAIPRGGVVVAHPIARALNAELDLIIPRKIGAPHNPEVAVGAVAPDGTTIFNEELLNYLGLTKDSLQPVIDKEMKEIERQTKAYRGPAPPPSINGRTVILVDDGLATGYTAQAALIGLKGQKPERLILTIPVAPEDTLERLRPWVDEIVCLLVPADFRAVGQYYFSFPQTTDEEVLRLLRDSVSTSSPRP